MPIVKFIGRVLPAIMDISFDSVPQVEWEAKELDLHMKFTVRIVKSEVEVECEVERYQPEYLAHLYTRSFDLARACVDVAAFSTGISLMVHLDKFILPDGSPTSLSINDPRLSALCTAYQLPVTTPEERKNLEKVLLIVFGDPRIFMALNDLILANTLPHHAPTNCARVLEGLRTVMTPDGMGRDKGWPILRQNLQMDRTYLEFITEHSTGPRHGDRSHISGDVTMAIVGRTWTIMNRFLEFKKRGDTQLPLVEFPMLVGQTSQEMMRSWVDRSRIELRGGGLDESPDCYKRLDEVLASVSDSVRILHRLTPVGVAMASAKEFDPYKD